MDFETDLQNLFGSSDFYTILNVARDAELETVKRAYKKLALSVHPDRVPEAERGEANKRFQALSMIAETLLDADRRAIYDESGLTENILAGLDAQGDWYAYWRNLFPGITLQDITNFRERYRGSEEEREDIKKSYIKNDGDLLKIVDDIVCAEFDDIERIRGIIDELIGENELKALEGYVKIDQKKMKKAEKRAKKEANEAGEVLKQKEDELGAAFEKNRHMHMVQFNDMIESLSKRYLKPKDKAKTKKAAKKPKNVSSKSKN